MLHDILLEAGTNEVEFLEFYLVGGSYAINVEKVKQLVSYDPERITKIAARSPSLLGTLSIFDSHVPIVDLARHLNIPRKGALEQQILILTDFNRTVLGFLVDGVNRIHRFSWERFQPFSSALESYRPRFTGVVLVENRELLVLDFESILDDLHPSQQFEALKREIEETVPQTGAEPFPKTLEAKSTPLPDPQPMMKLWSQAIASAQAAEPANATLSANEPAVAKSGKPKSAKQEGANAKVVMAEWVDSDANARAATAPESAHAAPESAHAAPEKPKREQASPLLDLRKNAAVMFADDSGMFRMGLTDALKQAGFEKLQVFENGLDLWRAFQVHLQKSKEQATALDEWVSIIVSDIEMPSMDGLTVCKKIKDAAPNMQVILLSSLVTNQLELKAKAVGANLALSKKNLAQLPRAIDALLKEKQAS